MDFPKILVGAPVCNHYEYCLDKYIEALKSFDYPNYDILLVDNSGTPEFAEKLKALGIPVVRAGFDEDSIKMRMVAGRNLLRRKVIDEGYEYFFNLDQDVIPQKDALRKLFEANKKVITGIYYNYFKVGDGWNKLPILWGDFSAEELERLKKMDRDELRKQKLELFEEASRVNFDFSKLDRQMTNEEVEGDKVIEIKACGTGCILVHRSILERLDFKYNEGFGFDDVLFCEEVEQILGEKIFCRTGVKCEHLTRERPWSWASIGDEKFIIYGANKLRRG